MFKSKILFPLVGLAMVGVSAVAFQNCAERPFQSSADFASSIESLYTTDDFEVTPEDYHPTEKPKTETSYEAVLADRYYMMSLFSDIFGDRATTLAGQTMFYNSLDNGSPCSLHEDHVVLSGSARVLGDPMQRCGTTNPERLVAQVQSKASVTREVKIARVCSDLTNDTASMGVALRKIAGSANPTPTRENLVKAYELFYRNSSAAPDDGVIDALGLMFKEESDLDDWRSVIYTICVSPQWQVL